MGTTSYDRQRTPPRHVEAGELFHLVNLAIVPVIIDVRETAAFSRAHLPGSLNAPDSNTINLVHRLPPHDDVILVCKDGRHSEMVARTLLFCGFKNVVFLRGGLKAWRALGAPLAERRGNGGDRLLARPSEGTTIRMLAKAGEAFSLPVVLTGFFAGLGLLAIFALWRIAAI